MAGAIAAPSVGRWIAPGTATAECRGQMEGSMQTSFLSSLSIIPSLFFTIPSRFVLLTTGLFFLSFCGLSFPKPNGGFHC
ncbi:hypothetical protein niasHT_008005 [Heterodera trifolii]|uniref:Uncharacterized protein n=1 Tax=Heterodera trifolii TaxID=157864 RepID=A0ABD2LZN2_9BILA